MNIVRSLRHSPRPLAFQALLGFSLAACFAPALVCVLGHIYSLPQILTAIVGVIYAYVITVFWKPMVAYVGAYRRVRLERNASKPLTDRLEQLAVAFETQHAAWEAAENPTAKRSAYAPLAATVEDLRQLAEEISPKLKLINSMVDEANTLSEALPHRRAAAWFRRSLVSGLTGLAVAIAGVRGARLRDTWQADLAGAPEEGLTMGRRQQLGHAMGFVVAAVRMRSHVLSAPLWTPVDWLLATESRTRTLIAMTVGGQVLYIQKTDGLYTLLTEGWGWCGGCAVALHFLFQWLRKVRGIELALASEDSPEL